MAKTAKGGTEPIEISVRIFFVTSLVALGIWLGLHEPFIAKVVFLAGAGLHVLLALFSFTEVLSELNTKPSRSDLLQFGLIFAGGAGALGAVFRFVWHRPEVGNYLFIAAGAVLVLSFIPPIGRILYILWMGLGITMGLFVSPVIMMILYLLLIVPVGIVFKLFGRDLMRRQLDEKADSYWEEYPRHDDPSRYVKQF